MRSQFKATRAIIVTASLLAAACAPSKMAPDRETAAQFACKGGRGFAVEYTDDGIRLTTSANVYELQKARSSIGRKFSSDEVVFIKDDDRGVLVGAAGGPFKQCVEQRGGAA